MRKILTKPIYLTFNNSSNASANIQIPFAVKTIRCKGIAYNAGTEPTTASFGVLTSTLVENQALGIYYDGNGTSPYTGIETVFELNPSTNVIGQYTFTIFNELGNPAGTVSGGSDNCIVILEFVSEEM